MSMKLERVSPSHDAGVAAGSAGRSGAETGFESAGRVATGTTGLTVISMASSRRSQDFVDRRQSLSRLGEAILEHRGHARLARHLGNGGGIGITAQGRSN